jgi:hypothetical protein
MPFCTTCGANVTGTFCSQCGTPAAGAAAQAPAPPPPTAAPYGQPQPYPPAVPAARKTSPIVWVLVIVLGLFVMGGIAVAGFVAFVAHRVHQAVSVDSAHGGGVTFHTRGQDGKDAVVQFGGSGKVPSWVPVYPGSEGRAKFAVSGTADGGEGGAFTFTTSDDPVQVKSYYSDKAKNMGLTINMDSNTPEGGMIVAAENGGDHRTLQVIVGGRRGDTSVNVIYGRK